MKFRYIGDHTRTWGDLNLVCNPDEWVEFDENPDPRWFVELEDFGHTPAKDDVDAAS